MKANWPKSDDILNWDPEHMEQYWSMCSEYDQYPQLDLAESDIESQNAFERHSIKERARLIFIN